MALSLYHFLNQLGVLRASLGMAEACLLIILVAVMNLYKYIYI